MKRGEKSPLFLLLYIFPIIRYNSYMEPEEIKRVIREVKILDAVLKESEPTEEDNKIYQFVWLQIQDDESKNIYEVTLTLDDIKRAVKKESYLEGRKLIDFTTNLKFIEDPLDAIFTLHNGEIGIELIFGE
jgi:hypothetical protein